MKQPQTEPVNATYTQERIVAGLRKPENWAQLVQFGLVGASGFVINQAIFLSCYHALHIQYPIAYVLAFLVAFSNNFIWNRHWTFNHTRGEIHVAQQGLRFFLISSSSAAIGLGILKLLVDAGLSVTPAELIAIVTVVPISFVGNKLWSFSSASSQR